MTRGIYQIRNIVTGDCYVGQAGDITRRWATHRRMLAHGAHHSSRLQQAWDIHGAEAFVWEVIEEVPLSADLTNAEACHMQSLQPVYNTANVNERPVWGPADWRARYTRNPDDCQVVATVREHARCLGCGLAINIETRIHPGLGSIVEVSQPHLDTGRWEEISTARFSDGSIIELRTALTELEEMLAEQERYTHLLEQRFAELEAKYRALHDRADRLAANQ